MDLPYDFYLLVDTRHRKAVDSQTSVSVIGMYAVVNQITSQYAKPSVQQLCDQPPGDYPRKLRLPAVTTKVTHDVGTTGP